MAVDEAQPDRFLLAGAPQQHAVAGQGFGVGIVFGDRLFHQAQRLVRLGPGVQEWLGQPAPPHLIGKAQRPVRVRCGQRDQTVAAPFFRAYSGSGLVIHCLARSQLRPQALQGEANRLAADPRRRQALGAAHLGGQVQGPQTGGMAELARTAVQQRAQLLGAFAGEGLRTGVVGPRGALAQRVEPTRVEGVQRVEHRLVVAAHLLGDAGSALAAGAGQQDLAAPQDKGVLRAQPRGHARTLGVREGTHKNRRSHTGEDTTFSLTHFEPTLGVSGNTTVMESRLDLLTG